MNPLRYTKIILSLAVIFVAGGFVGYKINDRHERKHHGQSPWEKKDFTERRLEWLTEKLELTSMQIGKIRPILEEADLELQDIHEQTFQKTFDAIRRCDKRVEGELTTNQVATLEEIRQKHKERFKKWQKKEREGDPQSAPGSPSACSPLPCFDSQAAWDDEAVEDNVDEPFGPSTKVQFPFQDPSQPQI